MSEFTDHQELRIKQLETLFDGILKRTNLGQLVRDNSAIIERCTPSDVVYLVDALVLKDIPMAQLKTGINKLLNLLNKTISEWEYYPPAKDSYLGCFVENNRILDEKLKQLRPIIREINKNTHDKEIAKRLKHAFSEIEKVSVYYVIKENVLFPVIEKYIPEFRCLHVMWSFHDDIKRNLKSVLHVLSEVELDLKSFNRLCGDLFFNIYAIKFREERILYPLVQKIIPGKVLDGLWAESIEMGFPFYQPDEISGGKSDEEPVLGELDLGTGNMTLEQIKLVFNHLPVDITFVDEYNKVRFFSAPKKRIFPRTKAIIGRDVHNCHPPESVHVVEKIVESFRAGKKDTASFWISMKGLRLLIQYFAMRDDDGNYKGVVEVSQEITEIQRLQGEKRLLDWEE